MGWKQTWWEISLCAACSQLGAGLTASLSPCSSWEIISDPNTAEKLSAEEVFKVTGELSVFQDNLILPICFCKQLLLGCLMPAEEVVLRQVSVCWSKQIQLLFKHFQENQIYYTVRNQDVSAFCTSLTITLIWPEEQQDQPW